MCAVNAARSSANSVWYSAWRPGERKTVYLGVVVLAICCLVFTVYVRKAWDEYQAQTPGHPATYGDFRALWSYAVALTDHAPAELYNSGLLHVRQVALGVNASGTNPFPYPPTFMLLIWPLSLLPCDVAFVVWIAGTMALFLWAIWGTCSRSPACLLLAVVAPASATAIAGGQSGFLAAALIVTGLRLAPGHPVISGVMIGLLSFKPQLGLLVPVGFAAAGLWPAFAASCAAIAGLSLIATGIFGWQVWPAWVSILPAYNDAFDHAATVLKIRPTVMANLGMLGCPVPIARAVQALVSVVVTVIIWRCFRRDPDRLAVAALLVGTFLATPHAFVYDLPMVTAALVLFIEARLITTAAFTVWEVMVLVQATIFPVLMVLARIQFPVSAVCLVLVFAMIVRCQGPELDHGRYRVRPRPVPSE
jgi:hypothetical protein